MKQIAKRLFFASLFVLSALSVVAMVAPNRSAAAPVFRPVTPMHQVTVPRPAPGTSGIGIGNRVNRTFQSPQAAGANNFLGGNPIGAFNMGMQNRLAVGNGINGFGRNGLSFNGFGMNRLGTGVGFNGFGITGFGFTGLATSQLGFNGFATGLGAASLTGFGGVSSPAVGFSSGVGALRTTGGGAAFGVNPSSTLNLSGFNNLNGFNNFSPGTKVGFNGFSGL